MTSRIRTLIPVQVPMIASSNITQPRVGIVPTGSASSRFDSLGNRELLGDAPTASFPRRLDLFLRGSAYWNIRRDLRPFGDSPNGLGDLQAVFASFFQPLCSLLPSGVHAFPQTPNT
uniref:Uncharacterized protein n=1 Tax=Solanum tuberosum TaxID=4113 RepID=M1DYR5_SOLTU